MLFLFHTRRGGVDRVSVPSSPIAIEILMDTMARDRAHMYLFVSAIKVELEFCVNLEVHVSVLVANYSCSFELVVGEKIII